MRRIIWIIAFVVCLSVFLVGCGKKDVEEVVKDLDGVIQDMKSYQGVGTMVLHTGQQPQEYDVEVWYQSPHYYRIALANSKKDVTQIVLRNDDGVFVLTPHLNKSFRFQSDWPDNQGQVYLYQTLVQSILMDNERQFIEEKDAYVFDVIANYQNGSLARQKIWLNRSDYAPKQVEITDANANVIVEVSFTEFAFDKKFEQESFDMQHNMTSWNLQSLPAMAESDPSLDVLGEQLDSAAPSDEAEQFGILIPAYTPDGVGNPEMSDMRLGDQLAVLLRYSGDYNYTIMQARPKDRAASAMQGTLIDLGFTFGVLTGDAMKTLTWTYEGVEFKLSTGDMPQMEMIRIAQSVEGESGK